jgi:hypothetical protein
MWQAKLIDVVFLGGPQEKMQFFKLPLDQFWVAKPTQIALKMIPVKFGWKNDNFFAYYHNPPKEVFVYTSDWTSDWLGFTSDWPRTSAYTDNWVIVCIWKGDWSCTIYLHKHKILECHNMLWVGMWVHHFTGIPVQMGAKFWKIGVRWSPNVLWCHGWGCRPPLTASCIHIRSIQSVKAPSYAVDGHMGVPLHCYTCAGDGKILGNWGKVKPIWHCASEVEPKTLFMGNEILSFHAPVVSSFLYCSRLGYHLEVFVMFTL